MSQARTAGQGTGTAYWALGSMLMPGKFNKAVGAGLGVLGGFGTYLSAKNPQQYYSLQEIQQDPSRLTKMP